MTGGNLSSAVNRPKTGAGGLDFVRPRRTPLDCWPILTGRLPLYLTPCALQPLMRQLSFPDRFPFRPAIENDEVRILLRCVRGFRFLAFQRPREPIKAFNQGRP